MSATCAMPGTADVQRPARKAGRAGHLWWVVPALVLGLVAVAVHQVRKVRRLMRARHELEAIRRKPVRRSR